MRVNMLDPEITLFGRRILLKADGEDENEQEVAEEESSMENDNKQDESFGEVMDESANGPAVLETTNQSEKTVDSEKDSEFQEGEKESKDLDPKVLKKPDKILPCPRCSSMDTKFCYFNNYNVNQPRHFCKSCQRYWTAGGTMRNVPVGAGRRKNKNSSSRYCQITVSGPLQGVRFDGAIGVPHPGNGTVLTFGSESPFCEPVTVISIADKAVLNGSTRNGFNNRDYGSSVSAVTNGSIEDPSKKCAKEPEQHTNGLTNPIPGCFQWPYMWNPAVPVPSALCPAVFPVPIFRHPSGNSAATPMNIPWVVPQSPSIQKIPESNPNSPTLGKHTRDEEMATPRTVLMPKTLRIDNTDEAAKSSIWSTLGIKKDNKGDSISKGFFNSFESKKLDKKGSEIEATPVAFTKTNPVALCRSFDFQERA